MIQVAPRNTQKEFKMFEDNIMWAREYSRVCWLCRDRRNKKSIIQKVLSWIDTKSIIDIKIWHNSKNSIESIKIKNYCEKIVEIKFRINKIKPQTRITIVDDLKNKFSDLNKNQELKWELVGIDRAKSNDICYCNGKYFKNKESEQ